MRRLLITLAVLASVTGCGREPRKEAGFGRAVMEQAAEQAEEEGRKQDAHEYRNAAERYREEERAYERSQKK